MKNYYTILAFLFCWTMTVGQKQSAIVFDTSSNSKYFKNVRHYSKTDFSFIDSLELWNYQLDTTFKGHERDSLIPIAQLLFWRTKPIDDINNNRIYGLPWTPYMTFEIYNLRDSSFCYNKSRNSRLFSSCIPPNVGGDILIIDKYIFINGNVCLNCERGDTKIDYCRPVINYVFSKIDKTKITTLKSILAQFVIKAGQMPDNRNKQ